MAIILGLDMCKSGKSTTIINPSFCNPCNKKCIKVVKVKTCKLADVSVTKTASPNPIVQGQTLTYTILISNAGPANAKNVVLTDIIPSSIIGTEFSVDGGVTFSPWTGFYNIGTLPSGDSIAILIKGIVSPSATGTITNTANVISTTPDPNLCNNKSTASVKVETAESADISVIKTASSNPVNPGGEILTYTLDVSNAGPASSENVVLTDAIPSSLIGAEFSVDGGITFSPWTGSYGIGILQVGETQAILIRGTVSSPATGPIINTANVTSTTPDPNLSNNTSTINTQVNPFADISIVKTANPNPVNPGEILNYTLDVSNGGPAAAQNVILADSIPSTIINPEFSIDGGVTFNPWQTIYDLGTLVNDETRTILIRGTVSPSATGIISNTSNVISSTPDPNLENNTSTSDIEVNSTDVGVSKIANFNPVTPGQILTYTIDVSNFGPINAQNVVLTDVIPPEIVGAEFSIDGGVTFNPWPGSYGIGTLLNGETKTILIRGTVSPSATGTISNTVDVTSTTPDSNPSNNTSTVVVDVSQIPPSADVGVFKSANVNPVIPGDIVIYTINVSNFGPSDAENVVLTDAIPAGITGIEFSTDGGVTFNPWTGNYDIGTLLNGETRTILIRGIVSPSATGTISNTADVISTTPDPNLSNNTSTVVIEITEIPPSADVAVSKSVDANPVVSGETVVYTIKVLNFGLSDAQNVILTDVIPSEIIGAEFSIDGGVTFSPWPGSYDIGTLLNGETRTILIRGTVAQVGAGFIINTADVTSTTPDPNPSNNTSTVVIEVNEVTPVADVGVSKSVNINPVLPGDTVIYTIDVSNFGPADAENVVLTDVVPSSITGVEFSTDGGITFSPWTGSYPIGILLNGETRTILIRGTVSSTATGTITNTADVTSTTPDPNPSNNTSIVVIEVNEVTPVADVAVSKSVNVNPVIPGGDIVAYTINVSNFGPADAQNVVLTDIIPPEIVGAEFSIDGGVTFSPWTGSYGIGTLLNGETRIILIRGTVSPSATGIIINTADVISTTLDPNISNNISTVVIEVSQIPPSADVGVFKSVNVNPVIPGDIVVYTIDVSNFGPSDAENVVLTDIIPPGIE